MTKKVAEIVVEVLQAAGVRNCYGIVGDTLNTFAVSLSRSEIDWVHMHEEAERVRRTRRSASDRKTDGRGRKLRPQQPAFHK